MCGITGILSSRSVDPRTLEVMTAQLVHRGPDGAGTWLDQQAAIGLGHRRLAVIDLSDAGRQPMQDESGRFVIVFNGEIYNHNDLRKEIEASGQVGWRGHSDTETLLACLSRWGLARTLEKAVGMFAFALWDRAERRLTLARDRMGEKPLYYGWAAGSFLFGSELKALTRFPGFDNPVNRRALDSLVRWSYVPSPLSIYREIYKLIPGTFLTVTADCSQSPPAEFDGTRSVGGALKLERYWSLSEVSARAAEAPVHSIEKAVDGLEERLAKAIADQSIADVPVGTFLSGGIDSSTIAALQQKHSASKIQTFTIGFEEAEFDESGHAREIAKHLGTSHHEMYVTPRHALDVIPNLPLIYDEPFADSSQIPTHLLSRVAKSRVKVALSGDGADELFGGYDRYRTLVRYHRSFRKIPRPAQHAAAALLRRSSPSMQRLASALPWLKRIPKLDIKSRKVAAILDDGQDLAGLYAIMTSHWDASCDVVLGAPGSDPGDRLPRLPQINEAAHLMLWDSLTYLPDDILCKVDRAAMHTSLETRAPFLDHRVVEFAARITTDLKVAPGGSKWALRQLLYRHVPRSLIDRPKSGFSIPLANWLRGPLRDWAEDLLDPERLNSHGYFDAELVRDRWQKHLRQEYDYSAALWAILTFQSWLMADRRLESEPVPLMRA